MKQRSRLSFPDFILLRVYVGLKLRKGGGRRAGGQPPPAPFPLEEEFPEHLCFSSVAWPGGSI